MKSIYSLSLCLLAVVPTKLGATNEELFVRVDGNGYYEAVVAGLRDNICGPFPVSPNRIEREGSEFRFRVEGLVWCASIRPITPPIAVSVSAALGYLAPGAYSVTWEQAGDFTRSVSFVVPGDILHRSGFESVR